MRESGQLDSAYHYLDGALKLARQGGITSYTAYLLSSLGNIYTEKKLYEKALAYKKASLNYSEKRNTIYSGRAFLRSGKGSCLWKKRRNCWIRMKEL